ncbi:ABC transporter substrate-binding protein [Oceanibacterium hippocampi]|uniref:Spermidine/putrescine-binding periplasmic protein n=1 Tax=Oceanibacterium hippocampi TaxID=745714 RepID=A0A1Y5TIL4_9PROT|nr:extracellular solute-binding protein [Oceanibacterium hippocampi]SLN64816.1 Spermidine/putrescine-binding periplasmic protein precursor [Oceanibacterium hippocampi]
MSNYLKTLMDRRRFLESTAMTGAGAAALAGFGSSAARAAGGELHILFAGGTWQKWFTETFVDDFAKAEGANIVWKTGLSFEPLVIAQRRRPQWDLIHQNQNTSSQLGAMDAVIEWTEDMIPNLKDIHPSFRYPYLAGKIHTPYGLVVNTKRVKSPITKWADLWNPELKGKVAFPAWNWMGQEVFHAINQLEGGSPDNVDPGIAKLKALYTDNAALTIENVEHTKQLLVEEEVWVAPYFGARTEQAAAAGAPVEFVVPEEGGLSFIWNTAIINGRPKESTELAAKLVNYSLDPERQIAFSRLTGYPPTNIQAMKNLPPDLKRLELTDEQVEGLGKIQREFDYMAMFAYRDEIKDRWNKEVLGS